MDTTWFAVDRDGHVAVFESGEAGAVPIDGYTEDWGPILDELVKAAGGGELDADDGEERSQRLAELGLYSYSHDDWENALAGPYQRAATPAQPMAGSNVPRGLLTQMVSFDGRFADTERLQPAEHWASDAWSDAWIASDGRSVHCVPGHEKEYAKHFAELQEALEDKDLAFDPPGATSAAETPAQARALPAKRWWQFWRK